MIIAARDGFVFGREVHTNTLPTKLVHILPLWVRNTLLQAWRKPALKKDVASLTALSQKRVSQDQQPASSPSSLLVALVALEKRKETPFDE